MVDRLQAGMYNLSKFSICWGGLGMDETLKNKTRLIELRKELRQLAEDFYVVYKEFVDAGFNEEQALALTVIFMKEEGE